MRDEEFMEMCLAEARAAWAQDEVPVGALISDEKGNVIAAAHNMTRSLNSPAAHAEMLAIEGAARMLGNYRLTECTLFVTMEPCIMCAGAMVNARLGRLVYGCMDDKGGAAASLYSILSDKRLNHRVEVLSGVLADECRELLQHFFRERRQKNLTAEGAENAEDQITKPK